MSERTHRRTSGRRATEGGGTAFLLLERFRGARGATAAAQTAAAAMVTAQAFPPSRPTTRCKPIVVVDVVIAVTAIRNGPIVRVSGATAKGRAGSAGRGRGGETLSKIGVGGASGGPLAPRTTAS